MTISDLGDICFEIRAINFIVLRSFSGYIKIILVLFTERARVCKDKIYRYPIYNEHQKHIRECHINSDTEISRQYSFGRDESVLLRGGCLDNPPLKFHTIVLFS